MKLHDNILYIEFADFLSAGWKEQTIKMANHRNGNSWQMIKNPADKRMPMVRFDTLVQTHKDKLQAKFGNVYEYLVKLPIKAMVVKDAKAEAFYMAYKYDGNKPLPIDETTGTNYPRKYALAASWLNMLLKVGENKKEIKRLLNLSLDQFYTHVCDIITVDDIALPHNYRSLIRRVAEYKEKGYDCLIDWRFGNNNAAKIGKTETGFDADIAEKQLVLIRKMASMHNNFNAMQVADAVNLVFQKNGWPVVHHKTVYNLMQESKHLTTAGARGQREYNNTIAMQVKRKRTEYPLQYCTLDGWTAELLYQEKSSYHNRLVVVVVLDVMNNYPLGYAIGDRENAELIRQANRNAVIHASEIFGAPYRPWQLQSDNYALKSLTPFYEAVAHLHTPAAVGNAKSKVIEPYFNYLNKTYCQRQYNWSGFNVTSKKSNQPNAEMLNKIKTSLPTKDEVIGQINHMMLAERRLKFEEYKRQFDAMPESERCTFTEMERLMVFGKPTGYTNAITGAGLTPTIEGKVRFYDTFDPAFRALHQVDWKVIYDAEDLNTILAISEDNKHRFVLNATRFVPMDVRSSNADDHNHLSAVRAFNKARKEEVVQTYINDAAIVEEIINNTPLSLDDEQEASLKLMFSYKGQQKEKLQDAKGLKRVEERVQKAVEKTEDQAWQNIQLEYMKSKVDFNEYLD